MFMVFVLVEAGHIHEKQAVEEGINLKDWLQVKGFKKNVTMDAQTAHLAFNVSDEGKKAQYSTAEANNSSNKHPHVLGKERLISGQHYWEVKMGDNCTEKLSWYIGVARENAQRKSTIPLTPQYGFLDFIL
ncbi:E3 ubiquitin-protein ligase TRIM68-like [Coregonus clupeaformis]|uniref:E3 ubiquitin-protein ligase TRIM68-like n=1 Tax=Coregonus clupeaformis TaxID=59861 RepID=UPI001E1C3CCA|nr:E3 ubiquitin-protein ligase TRIM68-like [Coregonus clupeaformis]